MRRFEARDNELLVLAGLLDRTDRKIGVGRFQLLQANHVGLGGAQPAQQVGQPPVDVVDIECRNLHVQTEGMIRKSGYRFSEKIILK